MEIIFTELVPVVDTSSVGEARRRGLLMAERLGFDEVRCGEIALLLTEVSRNVLVHGGGGETIILGIKNDHGPVARILALDKGPGIADVAKCLHDGYSTAGSMGGGMGAMRRIANVLEVYSARNGTVILLEVRTKASGDALQIAGLAIPYPGERFCGDAWSYHQTPERTTMLVVDGLGHGREASEAATEAIQIFQKHIQRAPGEILSYLHDALRKTRGAVAAIAEIELSTKSLTYAGVGNVSGVLLSGGASRSLVSHNGTLGLAVPRIQEFRVDWPDDAVLIMHSDGLQSRWDLSSYSGLLARHAAVIGGTLFRDYRRQRDDASVVVVKAAA